jgi:hypothetical protein
VFSFDELAVAGAGAEACGLSSLLSQPTSVKAVSSAREIAAKRNGFILYPWPIGPVGRHPVKYYPQVSLIQKVQIEILESTSQRIDISQPVLQRRSHPQTSHVTFHVICF